jgi:hypothetical protein
MNKDFKIELENFRIEDDFGYVGYKVYVDGNYLINLFQTCEACPEQYDLLSLLDNKQLAYFRLRWGVFRVDVPDVGGETIYSKRFDDGFKGSFREEEREEELIKAIMVVMKNLRKEDDDE